MFKNRKPSRFSVIRITIVALVIGLVLAFTALASTGTHFAFIDSVSTFLGLAPTQSSAPKMAKNDLVNMAYQPGPLSPLATAIAAWGFETVTTTGTATTPTITGSASADTGAQTTGSSFTGLHASASTVWSNPVGNGSAKSMSSEHWGVGDYYQFLFNTTAYNSISITWDQTGSSTGPRDFKVQYSTDGISFINATGTNSTYAVLVDGAPNTAWVSSGSPNTAFRMTLDLSSVTALNNQSAVYIS